MKTLKIEMLAAVVLTVLLGTGALGYAMQEHPAAKQEPARPQQNSRAQARPAAPRQAARPQTRQAPSKPQQQAQRQQPAHTVRPKPKQQAARAPQEQHQKSQTAVRAPQQQPTQQRKPNVQQARSNMQIQRTPQQQHLQQSAFQQHRAGNWQSDHRTWAQRGGYNGYRIPDARFNGYFGQSHGFRIGGLPFQVVGGYPRFQYGGYWFSLVDPYPGNWASDWYDTDDVYVSYTDNGYYLYNSRYPGIGLAVSISM